MEPNRWQKLEALFEAALDLDETEREALLSTEPDRALADEVRDLLAADASESPLDKGALGEPNELAPGTVVGGYTIDTKLGSGTSGAVYRAMQPELDKPVAIKVLDTRGTTDRAKKRFLNEARAASAIGHEGIVDVFAFGELDDGTPYYVMDYVDGPSLSSHVLRGAPFSAGEVVTMLAPLADALDAAHRHGVVHRDLKPANVMIDETAPGGARPLLVDFGIAKLVDPPPDADRLTKTGATLGTPAYMSPEQARGREVTFATDVYALGVMAFEMLTGRRPFTASSALEMLDEHINTPPPLPSSIRSELPPAVDAAVLAMLAKQPEQRPSSAGLAIAALASAKPEGPAKPPPVAARSRTPYLIGAALLLVAIAVVVLTLLRT